MIEEQQSTVGIAEQIKERVRQADHDRITKRADAAAAVATKLAERAELMKQVSTADNELASLVTQATAELMTETELADFVGVKPTELAIKQTRRAPRKRRNVSKATD